MPADRSLAASERLAGEIVSLPLYPDLSDDEASHVASAVLVAAEGDEARATPSRLGN
jgi:dTDP-4-amino-4,6-dideoxygalactose transaminase